MGEKVWITSGHEEKREDGVWSVANDNEYFSSRTEAIKRAQELAAKPDITFVRVYVEGPAILVAELK